MSSPINRQRVRLAVDLARKSSSARDVASGERGVFARASGLQIEVALLYHGALADISPVSSATLELKQSSDPASAVAMTRTVTPSAAQKALTEEQWASLEPDKCHFLFEFSAGETASAVFGTGLKDTQDHWLLLHGLTSGAGADRVVFGAGLMSSFEAGLSASGAPPPGPVYLTAEEIRALLQDYVTYDVPAGKCLRFRESQGAARVLGFLRDPVQGLVRVDDLEEP